VQSTAIHRSPVLILLVLLVTAGSVRAAGAEEDKTFKYELLNMEGSRYRFNKESGDLEKLVLGNNGVSWVKQSVQGITSQAPTQVKSSASTIVTEKRIPETIKTSSGTTATCIPSPNSGPRDPLEPEIRFYDDKNEDITDVITDDTRRASAPTITNYENKLSIAQSFNIADRITGTIMVRNSGDKRLRALELTMSVVVNGKSKPEERHFLFVDKLGSTPPPQPGGNGKEGMPLLQKVDIATPAGEIKGSPELRITFIQFAD
jgi:hypothetical protein